MTDRSPPVEALAENAAPAPRRRASPRAAVAQRATPAPGPTSTSTSTSTVYEIGDLAREFDLTTRAIRFYEDCGLLQPRREGRKRVYTARDRTRLKLTLRGKRLGLTLAEVRELVDMYDSPRDTAPQLEKFLQVLGAHRAELEERLADLHATLDEVRMHEREARRLLAREERGAAPASPAVGRSPRASRST